MNYTKNYRLPQWVKSDRIMMDDFNAAMASMESGMTRAEGKADTAISTANAARQTANASAAARPYVVGSYTGDGETKTITLGFRPSAVLSSGMKETFIPNNLVDIDRFTGISSGGTIRTRVKFSDTGFTVLPRREGNHYLPDLY